MAKKQVLKPKQKKLIKRYKKVLQDAGVPVKRIILFGSFAKGNQHEWSDIDLCLVTDKFAKSRFDELVKVSKLAARVDPIIEPVPLREKDLKDPYYPLADEIRKNGFLVG